MAFSLPGPKPVRYWRDNDLDRLRAALLNGSGSIFEYIPSPLHAAVLAGTSTADLTPYLQAALAAASSGQAVDGAGLGITITSSVTVPAGVTLRNARLTAGVAGMDMVLVNTGSKVLGCKLTGTGTTSIVERAIYPAADGVSDVELDVEVSNITVGVHAQPLAATTPMRWTGKVYVHDIVGTTGASEGYGVLLSPAESCSLDVIAEDVKRHAVYLSAGAKMNDIRADVNGCGNVAIQLFSSDAQPATEQNTITAKVRGVYVPPGQAANQAVGVYLLANVHQNRIVLDMDGEGTAEAAVTIEGSGGAGVPLPTGNIVTGCTLKGEFLGASVIRALNELETLITDNSIQGYGTNTVISLGTTGTPTIPAGANGASVYGNKINALGESVYGIYVEATAYTTYVGPNDIRNNGAAARVLLGMGALRTGHSREVSGQEVIACLANAANSAVVTFPEPLDNVRITAAAVNMSVTGIGFFPAHGSGTTGTGDVGFDLTVYNGCASAQDLTVNWVAQGD